MAAGRTRECLVAWFVLLSATLSQVALAQDEPDLSDEPNLVAYEEYVEQLGLRDVLAAHLRARVRDAAGETRFKVAERLGALYVTMLGEAKTAAERTAVEEQARELLKLVPESETFELRINLAKVSYLKAEELAEKERLRLASVEERAEAIRIFRGVSPTFEEIARQVQTRIDGLERQERQAADDVLEKLRAELATANRVRSLARYYLGWTWYYQALLGATSSESDKAKPESFESGKALENFGWILQSAPGKPPSVAQLPKSLLKYEHVGRAAIGTALTLALRGNDVEAIRWLDEIESIDDLHPAVRAQTFTRRLIIYASANRWSDAESLIRRTRQPDLTKDAIQLSPADARLAAVLGLEATRAGGMSLIVKEAAERVAQTGMADLVARGEVSQILDLVARYGTAPIGDTGFIVRYIQGLQIYEKAREAQKVAGNAEGPTTDTALINQYREGAELLRLALASADAAKFSAEMARARLRRGFALYYAGDLEEAAAEFQRSHEAGTTPESRRDALWYAIVALDRAVEGGKPSATKDRDRLAILYLQQFPDTEDAAKLLLRQSQADLLGDEEAIKILMAIAPEQPLYDAARRQATRILYRLYRRAPAADKGFAAIRFADVAESVLRQEAQRAGAGTDESSTRAAQNVMLLVRQLSDALLSGPAPDVKRAEAALQLLDAIATMHRLDVGSIDAEMSYRRLQLAIAKEDSAEIERCVLRLRQNKGEFALAGERLMYRRALAKWNASTDDASLAAEVVRHGRTILENSPAGNSASLASIRVSVAAAAAAIWNASKDEAMRDLAIKLDKQSVEAGGRTEVVLRRLATMSEETQDYATALSCWQYLFAALPEGEADWYEARYESLRLLWRTDQSAAVLAMKQFRALYPKLGPEPWREKIADLEQEMQSVTPPAPAPKGGAK